METKKPWVERYRPKNLKEVSHQSEVVATLQNAVVTGRLPHMLFYGPPGSGKVRARGLARSSVVLLLLLPLLLGTHSLTHSSPTTPHRPRSPWRCVDNSGILRSSSDASWNSTPVTSAGFPSCGIKSSTLPVLAWDRGRPAKKQRPISLAVPPWRWSTTKRIKRMHSIPILPLRLSFWTRLIP
jgi:hypothetical protein